MKKLVLALLAPLLPAFCLAANNIKMVTYFPVPYASYSNLGVAGTCDVGLLNTCSLDSGPSLKVSKKGSTHALNSGAITVNSGMLSLNTQGKVSGISLTAGSTLGNIGSGSLEFKHNLTVKSMPSTIQSAEATNEAIMKSLTLFGQTFPGCDAANNKISWRNLTLNGENGVYLVCGEGAPMLKPDPCEGKYTCTLSKGAAAGISDKCTEEDLALFSGGKTEICDGRYNRPISCVYKSSEEWWLATSTTITNPCTKEAAPKEEYVCSGTEERSCQDLRFSVEPSRRVSGRCYNSFVNGEEYCTGGHYWCPGGDTSLTPAKSEEQMCMDSYSIQYPHGGPGSFKCRYGTGALNNPSGRTFIELTCSVKRDIRIVKCVPKSKEATIICKK